MRAHHLERIVVKTQTLSNDDDIKVLLQECSGRDTANGHMYSNRI